MKDEVGVVDVCRHTQRRRRGEGAFSKPMQRLGWHWAVSWGFILCVDGDLEHLTPWDK